MTTQFAPMFPPTLKPPIRPADMSVTRHCGENMTLTREHVSDTVNFTGHGLGLNLMSPDRLSTANMSNRVGS